MKKEHQFSIGASFVRSQVIYTIFPALQFFDPSQIFHFYAYSQPVEEHQHVCPVMSSVSCFQFQTY